MGYISLQFTKVKGTSDTRRFEHIERKTIPSNADPTRTHLNRELIGEANEVRNRDQCHNRAHPVGRNQTENYPQPSTGYPHHAFGHTRGYDAGTAKRTFE